jgi:hypothetical protein
MTSLQVAGLGRHQEWDVVDSGIALTVLLSGAGDALRVVGSNIDRRVVPARLSSVLPGGGDQRCGRPSVELRRPTTISSWRRRTTWNRECATARGGCTRWSIASVFVVYLVTPADVRGRAAVSS